MNLFQKGVAHHFLQRSPKFLLLKVNKFDSYLLKLFLGFYRANQIVYATLKPSVLHKISQWVSCYRAVNRNQKTVTYITGKINPKGNSAPEQSSLSYRNPVGLFFGRGFDMKSLVLKDEFNVLLADFGDFEGN